MLKAIFGNKKGIIKDKDKSFTFLSQHFFSKIFFLVYLFVCLNLFIFILFFLRKKTPIGKLDEQPTSHPAQEKEPLPAWPNNKNPHTGLYYVLIFTHVLKDNLFLF